MASSHPPRTRCARRGRRGCPRSAARAVGGAAPRSGGRAPVAGVRGGSPARAATIGRGAERSVARQAAHFWKPSTAVEVCMSIVPVRPEAAMKPRSTSSCWSRAGSARLLAGRRRQRPGGGGRSPGRGRRGRHRRSAPGRRGRPGCRASCGRAGRREPGAAAVAAGREAGAEVDGDDAPRDRDREQWCRRGTADRMPRHARPPSGPRGAAALPLDRGAAARHRHRFSVGDEPHVGAGAGRAGERERGRPEREKSAAFHANQIRRRDVHLLPDRQRRREPQATWPPRR